MVVCIRSYSSVATEWLMLTPLLAAGVAPTHMRSFHMIIIQIISVARLRINTDYTGAALRSEPLALGHQQYVQCCIAEMERAVHVPRLLHHFL